MSAGHTPGPWHAESACHVDEATTDVGQGAFQILSVAGEAGGVLCSRHRWPEREKEMNANARLIAAAPEMLAALKSAVAYADAMHRAQVWQDSQQHVDYVTFPEWRAVIAKAEGAKP